MNVESFRIALASALPRKLKSALRAMRPQRLSVVSLGAIQPSPGCQDLEMYWDEQFAQVLETWGTNSTWREIPLLLADCRGKVLDVACGTGKTIEILQCLPALQLYGCDISDYLIEKAVLRGVPRERLSVCDATRMPYAENEFSCSYSIGSLEHFTQEGISRVIQECHRVTRHTTIHMMPVSRSNRDEGWLKTRQSFFNNSVTWWVERFRAAYSTVHVLDSAWNDAISIGKWFVCIKEGRGAC